MAANDPFARQNPTNEAVVSAVAVAALLWSVAYLAWRAVATLAGADSPASIVLFAAEALGVLVFAAHLRAARHRPIGLLEVPDAPVPDTTAIIDAGGADLGELRTTLVSLKRVTGIDGVVIVGADDSRWLRTVAQRFGATVCEPTVTIVDALRGMGTNWALLLTAGDLPMPDLVTVCAARCSAPQVAVVQVATENTDPTAFEHHADAGWTLEPFEQQVVRPSLAATGSVPWYGDGPAMVRRSVVTHVESHRLPDDARLAGLALARAGFVVTHVPLTLARVRVSDGLGETLVRHRRRVRDAVATTGPRMLRGVPGPTRMAHLLGVTPVVAAVQRILLVITAVLVLGYAQVPIAGPGLVLAAFAVPSYLLRWASHLLLGRGRLRPFSLLRRDLRALGADLLPFATSRRALARTSVGSVAAVVVVLDVAAVVTAVAVWRNWSDRRPAETAAVALAVTAPFLGTAMEVLLDAFARRQHRLSRRVRLGLVTCRIEEQEGQLVDLSAGGVGVSVPCEPEEVPAVGGATTVSFRIPDADGAWRSVSALVTVVHRSRDPEGGTRVGLAFDDPTDAPLDPVIEFLTVDRRLVSLGRHSLAGTPRS